MLTIFLLFTLMWAMSTCLIRSALSLYHHFSIPEVTPIVQRLPSRLIDPLLAHVNKAQLYRAASPSRHSR